MNKGHLCLLLVCLLLFRPVPAGASNFYLFPDSNTRRLTYEEVAAWQYDALGYAFNELFARYGRPFEPGGKYDNYFQCQTWYRVDPGYPWNGDRWDDGPRPNNVEWYNYQLFKQVRADMKAQGTTNPTGKPLPRVVDDRINGLLSGFREVYFEPDQKLRVYDGPGTHYRRGANGKAVASTNGRMYAAGWESGWLMVMYQTNNGGVRVGFASPGDFRDKLDMPQLSFQSARAVTIRSAQLTEDPVMALTPITQLPQGTPVTWLSRFYSQQAWDYVEVYVNGQLTRGFLTQGTVDPGFAP